MDATELSRMRWRCRRGMLENDLILTRFLDARGGTITLTAGTPYQFDLVGG